MDLRFIVVINMGRGRGFKRKRCTSGGGDFVCIVHGGGACSDKDFVTLNTVKGGPQARLESLIEIRDRRLEMPIDSPYRMTEVCNQIPNTLVGIDTSRTGYHKSCYKLFIMNLDRLKNPQIATPKTPPTRHSPRKQRSLTPVLLSPETRLFPATCIFCEARQKRRKI